MDEYEVSLNLSDGRVVVVTVQATSERDAIARARFDYGQQDASATFNYDIAPVVTRRGAGGGAASGGSGAGAGAGAGSGAGAGDSRFDYPFYNQTSPSTGSRGAPPVTTGVPTPGTEDGLTRADNIELLANEGGNEAAAIEAAYRDINPGQGNNSSLLGGLLDQFLGVLTNAFQGASASGRLDPNITVPEFVRGQNPRSARRETAANLLALLGGEGLAGEGEFNANEANDQLVSASGAFGNQFRRSIQGRLGEFNNQFQSAVLDPGATEQSAYAATFDQLFPNLRRALERQVGAR